MALFVPLDASYPQDPKILDLDDERSELLFIRSLAYCKAHLTDGLIHRRALHQIAPCADDVAADVLAADLVRTGLWAVTERGWRVTAWLKRNPASEEILTPSKGRELAHQRHHVKKGVQKEGCPFCFPAEDPQVAAHDAVQVPCVDAVRDAPDAMPEPYPEPEPEPSSDTSPQTTSNAPPDSPPVDVEQQVRRAIGIFARTVTARTPNVTDPGAYAHGIGLKVSDDDRTELAERIAAGESTEDAAAWLADPMRGIDGMSLTPGITPAAVQAAADAAKRREAETAESMAAMRAEVPAPPPTDLRDRIRAVPALGEREAR
jgi:hypothetical protein